MSGSEWALNVRATNFADVSDSDQSAFERGEVVYRAETLRADVLRAAFSAWALAVHHALAGHAHDSDSEG